MNKETQVIKIKIRNTETELFPNGATSDLILHDDYFEAVMRVDYKSFDIEEWVDEKMDTRILTAYKDIVNVEVKGDYKNKNFVLQLTLVSGTWQNFFFETRREANRLADTFFRKKLNK